MLERTVLVGDSHLARVKRDLRLLGENVLNVSEGGAVVSDLLGQTAAASVGQADVVVVSVGTNDAAPWKSTPLQEFEVTLTRLVRTIATRRWVYLAPPGIDAERLTGPDERTNAAVTAYRDTATAIFGKIAGCVVPTHSVIAPLGRAAFVPDGVHLSGRAYDVVLPVLRAAIDSCGEQCPRRHGA